MLAIYQPYINGSSYLLLGGAFGNKCDLRELVSEFATARNDRDTAVFAELAAVSAHSNALAC